MSDLTKSLDERIAAFDELHGRWSDLQREIEHKQRKIAELKTSQKELLDKMAGAVYDDGLLRQVIDARRDRAKAEADLLINVIDRWS